MLGNQASPVVHALLSDVVLPGCTVDFSDEAWHDSLGKQGLGRVRDQLRIQPLVSTRELHGGH